MIYLYMQECKKIILLYEDVSDVSKLTEERNKQLKHTTTDWVLFLDDDDYWPRDQLELCLNELGKEEDILAYSVTPYQLLDEWHYDTSWEKRSFSKFLKKEGLSFTKPWPKDLPINQGKFLHWKKHPDLVKKLPYRFFHLSNLKYWSFRNQDDYKKYYEPTGKSEKLINPFKI